MFDPNGPFDEDMCNEILIEVSEKRKSEKTKHLSRIEHIAKSLGYDRYEVKNNAEYLIKIGYINKGLGGFLGLTGDGAAIVNQLLE
ncbi:hypothetical protein DO021_21800 [Desulfobacter hydrogenophilus]|uniref:Uncharacterized protein n=1 Tax=Desulfobacter hydrogenophilus TaxID=2291 RepID=A0A328F938_9BACT|nr:hypothetical protein [Desulfobacter hydrogenophilus]NDY74621.1 hypothetical protein [Desulfobacter hydrogenophilus]QBH14289.1 hypothetical protein EYB58_16025 [Desulfobacter hydrogenophilus]RAL99921.1 hypothetical protein DO021_21800 [Desulfobacter hydrogenophilus]